MTIEPKHGAAQRFVESDVRFGVTEVVEGILGIIPGGSAAAKLVTLPFDIAERRYNRKIIDGIIAGLNELQDANKMVKTPRQLIEDDSFIAALHTTFRASQETADDDKRRLLRNGLINGIADLWASEEQPFLGLIRRYEPEHIAILARMKKWTYGASNMLENARHSIVTELGDGISPSENADRLNGYFNQLLADGLLRESTEVTVPQANARNQVRPIRRLNGDPTRTRIYNAISPRGVKFLDFVADPLTRAL